MLLYKLYRTYMYATLEGTGRTNRPKSELTTTTNAYVLVKWHGGLPVAVFQIPVGHEKKAPPYFSIYL